MRKNDFIYVRPILFDSDTNVITSVNTKQHGIKLITNVKKSLDSWRLWIHTPKTKAFELF